MKKNTLSLIIVSLLVGFACLHPLKAVVPPPDGGYPNFNTAEGQNALFSLTIGSANTAVGWYSLFSDTGGSFNTATGAGALLFNTADQNTAFGAAALLFNTTGFGNTAVGAAALLNNTASFVGSPKGGPGSANTAVGVNSLSSNTAGSNNTAVGAYALVNNTSFNNIALGAGAGNSVTNGSNVIAIGTSGANVDNSCYIGNIYGAEISKNAAFVFVDADGKVGTGAVDGNNVILPSPQTMLNEFNKQQKRIAELNATVTRQQTEIDALTAGLQKVSAQLELNKPAPQTVKNDD